jgi:hypothetical protein
MRVTLIAVSILLGLLAAVFSSSSAPAAPTPSRLRPRSSLSRPSPR